MIRVGSTVRSRERVLERLDNMARDISKQEREIRQKSADIATRVSKQVFEGRRSQRGFVSARPGRPTTQGAFATYLKWEADKQNSMVEFDWATMENRARYFIIQEVGTNASYTAYAHYPWSGEQPDVWDSGDIPPQRGRLIPPGLVWGDGGAYHRPQHGRRSDQISSVKTLTMAQTEVKKARGAGRTQAIRSTSVLRAPQVRIRKEIKGKHFIKQGGQAGMRMYRNQLLRAAEKTLRLPRRG